MLTYYNFCLIFSVFCLALNPEADTSAFKSVATDNGKYATLNQINKLTNPALATNLQASLFNLESFVAPGADCKDISGFLYTVTCQAYPNPTILLTF